MIRESMVIALVASFFVACSSNDIKDAIQDIDDKYFSDAMPAVVENNGTVDQAATAPVTEQIQALLDVHNNARADVGVASVLVWDDTLAQDAQNYADILATNGTFEHDPKNHAGYVNGPYGENLYAEFPAKPSLQRASLAWGAEKVDYTYGKIGKSETCVSGKLCGHYTQMIWKNTSQVGCATSQYTAGTYKDGYVIVCKYKQAGNVIGRTPY